MSLRSTKYWDEKYKSLEELMGSEGISLEFKDLSLLQRSLGKVMFWSPRYMTNIVTTIGSTVYWPRSRWYRADSYRKFATMAHEVQHVLDSREYGLRFFAGYLMPQALAFLALLSFGAFWSPWWVLCLLFLVFLVPKIKDSPRADWEIRGYRINYAIKCYLIGEHSEKDLDRYRKIFEGPSYYWMMKNSDRAIEDFLLTGTKVLANMPTGHTWLDTVVSLMRVEVTDDS